MMLYYRIQKFIAELRSDPNLWAAFQHDIEQIHLQYNLLSDSWFSLLVTQKIRENKEHARTPRSKEDHEH
ncbi:hypothetical protein PHMEG_00037256, partial [Phytophthora megakarya]